MGEASGNAGLAGRDCRPRRCWPRTSGSPRGPRSCARPGWTAGWTRCGRVLTWTSCSGWTPGRSAAARTAPPQPQAPATGHRPRPQPRAPVPVQALAPAPGGPLAGMIPPGFAGQVTLTVPEATVTGRADRPGDLSGIGPVDPDLARDLAQAAARNPRSTWCVTVTDSQGHAIGHGCARPAKRRKPDGPDPPGGPRFTFTPTDHPGPPGGYGTWRFTTGQQDLLIEIGPIPTGDCDHRWQARGHDPGVDAAAPDRGPATPRAPGPAAGGPRPAARCDFEHNVPYEAGGRTCLCNGGPKCRPRPPAQAAPAVERRAASGRIRPVDRAVGTPVRHRTDPVPHLSGYRGG